MDSVGINSRGAALKVALATLCKRSEMYLGSAKGEWQTYVGPITSLNCDGKNQEKRDVMSPKNSCSGQGGGAVAQSPPS
jgi:hypothetical protein